jgi:hypothetical protein
MSELQVTPEAVSHAAEELRAIAEELRGGMARQLGNYFHSLGFNENVRRSPTDRANFLQLTAPVGSAILPNSNSTVFSHVLDMTLDEIEQLVRQDL